MTAQETFADTYTNVNGTQRYVISVGDFVYNGTAHSSMKVTFMSEAEY